MRRYALSAMLTLVAVACQAQEFFNLTSQEVGIDSVAPRFSYSREIGRAWADSVYTVSIAYPEYMDITPVERARLDSLGITSLPAEPLIEQSWSVCRGSGTLIATFMPLVCQGGRWQKIVSFMIRCQGKAKPRRAQAKAAAADRYARHSRLATGRWAVIACQTGVAEITAETIAGLGLTDPRRVRVYGYGGALQPEALTDEHLRATDDLPEVPITDIGGRRYFYAQGPVSWDKQGRRTRNPYSDTGRYLITEGEPSLTSPDDFRASIAEAQGMQDCLTETDDYAWYHSGANLYDARLLPIGQDTHYTLTAHGTGTGALTVSLTADAATRADILLGGEKLGTIAIANPSSGDLCQAAERTATYQLPSVPKTADITIRPTSGGNVRLDYITLHADTPRTPDEAIADAQTAKPLYQITNQDHHADPQADMVIIIPTSQKLRPAAERIARVHRQQDGMTVNIVPADELYNEFSSATPDAAAYRRYMKMLYDRAQTQGTPPTHLLLLGDGAYDNRLHLKEWQSLSPDDLLLTVQSDNSFSQTQTYVAEDWYGLLDDGETLCPTGTRYGYTGAPDIAIGRIPARTAQEAAIVATKIEHYTAPTGAGAWQNTIVLMGDDGNNNDHIRQADEVATQIEKDEPALSVKRILWDAYTREVTASGNRYPEVERIVKRYMTDGALLMDYVGHGNTGTLSHEIVLDINDFRNTKSTNLPLWLTAACDVAPFDTQEANIGETALFNPNGAAVAFIGTARTVYPTPNAKLNKAFVREALRTDQPNTIGEALRRAKTILATAKTSPQLDNTTNKLHFVLLGDPALKLAIPNIPITIDNIDGQTGKATARAGERVKIEGHIDGISDFRGLVTIDVLDAPQLITCRHNDQTGTDQPYVYTDRQSTIYHGTDSVRAGRFNITFAVPKDIQYSQDAARIVAVATDNHGRRAHGYNEDLTLYGTATFQPDATGPSIRCYLNTPTFQDGDNTSTTPYFIAEIYDEDGINATGSSIGHDLTLSIDAQEATTWSMNDKFTFDFGSYQSGSVVYSIPELTPGEHTLTFRAWDILNHSNSSTLRFNVVRGLQPELYNVYATQNPATTATVFRITHDRPGHDIDVRIEIFDMAGRQLWSHQQQANSDTDRLDIPWDLRTDGGRQLGTGVYLYRVLIATDGSSYASDAKKLIVITKK